MEAKLIRQRLREARSAGLIDGTEYVAEQLRLAGLLNDNRGRDPERWVDGVDPEDLIGEVRKSFDIRTIE